MKKAGKGISDTVTDMTSGVGEVFGIVDQRVQKSAKKAADGIEKTGKNISKNAVNQAKNGINSAEQSATASMPAN